MDQHPREWFLKRWMKYIFYNLSWPALLLAIGVLFLSSCGNSENRVFSLREGIGHFSMEYPSKYSVKRIDIRNDSSNKYTDIGLGLTSAMEGQSFFELSVYAWPVDSNETAITVTESMLSKAEIIFQDFELLQQFSVMVGDMPGQAATFSWTSSPYGSSSESQEETISAISQVIYLCYDNLAWEIDMASDMDSQEQAEDVFQHALDTFKILE